MGKGYALKQKGLYDPMSEKPYKISRSGIELFLDCPRCFYLANRLGIRRPSGPPFSLNILVDKLLKKEFDQHRAAGTAHPIMHDHEIDAVPFRHEKLDEWRENFKGVQFHHRDTGLNITGAIDDLWVKPNGEIIVVDYKATAKAGEVNIDADWQISYKRQMEIYQWLIRNQGLTVSNTGYFLYCNGLEGEAFNQRIEFSVRLLPYSGNGGWIEPAIREIKACLSGDKAPTATATCEFCGYVEARQ